MHVHTARGPMNPNKDMTITVEQFNRLTRQNQAMREALKQIIDAADDPENERDRDLVWAIDWEQARAALKED